MTTVRDDLGCLEVSTIGSQLLRITLSISFSAQPADLRNLQQLKTSYSTLRSLKFKTKWVYVSNSFEQYVGH